MKDSIKIALGIFLGIAALCACMSCFWFGLSFMMVELLSVTPAPASSLSVGLVPARAQLRSPDGIDSQQFGSSVIHGGIRIALNAYEISGSYVNDYYNMSESPPDGAKFLWILVAVENVGKNAARMPYLGDFHVVYEGKQTEADFFFIPRPGYDPYESGEIFPGVSRSGWLRFTIPTAAQPGQLSVVLKPRFSEVYYTWLLAQ